MKLAILLLATVVSLPLMRAEEPLPPDVQRVVDQRTAAIAKIDTIYRQELEKLKVNYTKQGNLAAANVIVGLLQGERPTGSQAEESVEDFLKGEWFYQWDGESKKYKRSFNATAMIDKDGVRYSWNFKDGLVVIEWGPGRYEKLTIDRVEPNVLRGLNSNGQRFSYLRVEKRRVVK